MWFHCRIGECENLEVKSMLGENQIRHAGSYILCNHFCRLYKTYSFSFTILLHTVTGLFRSLLLEKLWRSIKFIIFNEYIFKNTSVHQTSVSIWRWCVETQNCRRKVNYEMVQFRLVFNWCFIYRYQPPKISSRIAATARKRAIVDGTFGTFSPVTGDFCYC